MNSREWFLFPFFGGGGGGGVALGQILPWWAAPECVPLASCSSYCFPWYAEQSLI